MSKLYTEDQVIKAIQLAQKCEHDCGGVYFYCTEIEEVIEELTPIQLPTDEDIHRNRPYESISDWGIGFHSGWKEGAEWMRDKIKGGQGE